MEAEGSIATSLSSPAVDRKATLKLKRFSMNITGISETKWLNLDRMSNINNFTILHSGHSIPSEGKGVERNEGVGIVLASYTLLAQKHEEMLVEFGEQLAPGLYQLN